MGRSFTMKKGNLEFIHITKTGGTTIEAWAAKAGVTWASCHYPPYEKARAFCAVLGPKKKVVNASMQWEWSKIPEAIQNKIKDNRKLFMAWHTPPHWFHENPYKNKDTFTVVRNPYARA